MPTYRTVIWGIIVTLGAGFLSALGFWQLGRLGERRAHNALIVSRMAQSPLTITGDIAPDASLMEYRPAVVTGVFDFSQEVVVRNRAHDGLAGVRLLTPLRIAGSSNAVLVDRGWVPYASSFPDPRAALARPTGVVTVDGLIRLGQGRPSPLAPADPTVSPAMPRLDAWFWIDIPQIGRQVPYPLLPFYVEQSAGGEAGALPLAGPGAELSDGPHLAYAIEWFSFAVILVVGSIALARHRRKGRAAPAP